MSSTPVPSHLILLQDLKTVDVGTKVRFLGCIDGYDIPSSTLTLQHTPATPSAATAEAGKSAEPTRKVIAHVDVALLAETLSGTETAAGAWVNVIGYVVSAPRRRRQRRGQPGAHVHVDVEVQALMLWNAGVVELGAYEQAVIARREVVALDRSVGESNESVTQ